MASLANIEKKLDVIVKENKEDHEKIMRLLLGNGDVGLLEESRNHKSKLEDHEKEIEKQESEIQEIKRTYERRKKDTKETKTNKWATMPFYQKVLIFLAIYGALKIDGIYELITTVLK